jgi:hypothetical protein
MKMILSLRVILLALVAGLVGLCPSQAGSTTNMAAGTQLPSPRLDNDEMVQLQKAREQVLNANPDLKVEEEKLKALHESAQSQNPPATPEQRNAAFAEWKAYQKTMRAAMLKIDPTLGPIFAKLDESRKHGAPVPFQPASAK